MYPIALASVFRKQRRTKYRKNSSLTIKLVQSDIDWGNQPKISIVQGQLVLHPKLNQNKITSIQSWTDTFLIFAIIYLAKHPNDVQSILKYMQTIRLGANRSPFSNWIEYDRQFRLKMSKFMSTHWGSVDDELWLLYMSSQSPMTTQHPFTLKCYDYNFRGSCGKYPCLYQHSCMYCHKTHPRIYCRLERPQPNLHCQTCNSTHVNSVIPLKVSNHNSLDRDIWDLGHSPINIHNLKICLVDYPFKNIATSLLNGFQKGFYLHFTGVKIPLLQKKLKISSIS